MEGDERYTKVKKNVPPEDAQGWTIVLLERASRFIWELHWGRKDRKLFKRAIRTLVKVINTTGDLALITDGERRYGQVLFELCSELVRTGKRGRPPKTLLKGVQVRIKNKGSPAHKRGRNTRPLAGSIRKPLRRLRTPRFTPIIWRPLMPPCADGVQPIAEKPIPTPKRKSASSNASMSTGSSITLPASISPPNTSPPWPWAL